MCTEEFIRMMFTVDLYGNRGLDSRSPSHMHALADDWSNISLATIANGGLFILCCA